VTSLRPYGLPCHADSVLRIDPRTEEVTTIPLPPDSAIVKSKGGEGEERILGVLWKYHGGTICPLDGCIYAIPQCATRVLQIDPKNDEVTYVGPRLEGRYKWYGGLVGCDGAIYGIPQLSSEQLLVTSKDIFQNKYQKDSLVRR